MKTLYYSTLNFSDLLIIIIVTDIKYNTMIITNIYGLLMLKPLKELSHLNFTTTLNY